MKFILLVGRIFFSALFITASMGHFATKTIDYATNHGVPFAQALVPLSGIVFLISGLSILLGFKARFGAWLIVIFLLPATFVMHKFWCVQDANVAVVEQTMFMKNLALIGAALIIAYFGSGPLSVDRPNSSNPSHPHHKP